MKQQLLPLLNAACCQNRSAHANLRNFIEYGWNGVPFENGIALTRKNVGDGEWDTFAESWIP